MSGLVARPDRRPGRLACVLLLALTLLLGSCRSSPAPPPPPAPVDSGSLAAAQASLDHLTAAVRGRDQLAFRRQLSTADPAFAATASRIFDVGELPLTSLSLTVRRAEGRLSAARQTLLGGRGYVRQVSVRWAVAGDVAPAEHLIWFTFVPEGGTVAIAGITDGPDGDIAQPLWLLERLHAERRDHVTVLAGASRPLGPWLTRADAAAAAVHQRLGAGLRSRWNGQLVVELPSSRSAFERVLGVSAGSYAQIAAVSWPEGPDAATAAVRIVVNPALAGAADEQGLAVLLAHEATHVALRSSSSPAPTWLIEGYADYLAYDAYPRTAPLAARALLETVRRSGAPTRLPGDADFTPGSPQLSRAYAESWLACRYLADVYSPERLGRFYDLIDGGAGVDQASRAVFQVTEREFTVGWAHSLREAAKRGKV
ncbi:MAG TPA: hypothetical protein VF635_13940 [Propionibacteriaceae bacterium]